MPHSTGRRYAPSEVDTLRETYGEGFAGDFRGDAHLRTVLEPTERNRSASWSRGAESLTGLHHRQAQGAGQRLAVSG